jgi:quercetin dioxygenase-like cupin family protein
MSEAPGLEPVQVFSLDQGDAFSPLEGIGMRAVFGKGASLNLVTLDPGTLLPLHKHPHEQIGIVLEGVEILIVGGREYHLGPMQAYVVPSEVEHGGIGGPEGCVVLDIFIPTREEYRPAATAGRDISEEDPGAE